MCENDKKSLNTFHTGSLRRIIRIYYILASESVKWWTIHKNKFRAIKPINNKAAMALAYTYMKETTIGKRALKSYCWFSYLTTPQGRRKVGIIKNTTWLLICTMLKTNKLLDAWDHIIVLWSYSYFSLLNNIKLFGEIFWPIFERTRLKKNMDVGSKWIEVWLMDLCAENCELII